MMRFCIALLAFSALPLAALMAQTPVSHWRFDDGAIDSSTVTVTNSVNNFASPWANAANNDGFEWSSDGVVGGALALNGISGGDLSDDYFDIGTTGLTGAFSATWTAWIRPDAGQESGYTGVFMTRLVEDDTSFDANQNFGIAWENEGGGNGHFDARVSGAPLDSASLAAGEWYHVALVWDSDDANGNVAPFRELYIDGVSVGSDTMGIPLEIFDDAGWRLGQDYCCNNRDFRGLVDDLAVFDVALTAAEISSIYNNGLNNIDAAGETGPVFQPGDVDLDGDIDIADYDIINANMFSTGIRTDGDLTADNFVDFEDFAQWKNAFNAQAIPEPGTMMPLAIAGVLLIGLTRRRR